MSPLQARERQRWRQFVFALSAVVPLASAAAAIEEPPFDVVAACDGFEIRHYPEAVGAVTRQTGDFDDAGNAGFRTLADYIFGGNAQEERIAMTAPVAQARSSEAAPDGTVTFYMPRDRPVAGLPAPDDGAVALTAVAAQTVAVGSFSGGWAERRFVQREAQLREALDERGLPAEGAATWARYDPPWTLWFLRRNEIWIALPPDAASRAADVCTTEDA